MLSCNPSGDEIWNDPAHLDKIDWFFLSDNPSAIPLLEKHKDKIDWNMLSGNVNAIRMLQNHPEHICWSELSRNPNAIQILEDNLDKIDWNMLSYNPNASSLIDLYCGHIQLSALLDNPCIFELDYVALKRRIEPFVEELMMKCFHPNRLFYYLDTYGYDIGDDDYIDVSEL